MIISEAKHNLILLATSIFLLVTHLSFLLQWVVFQIDLEEESVEIILAFVCNICCKYFLLIAYLLNLLLMSFTFLNGYSWFIGNVWFLGACFLFVDFLGHVICSWYFCHFLFHVSLSFWILWRYLGLPAECCRTILFYSWLFKWESWENLTKFCFCEPVHLLFFSICFLFLYFSCCFCLIYAFIAIISPFRFNSNF